MVSNSTLTLEFAAAELPGAMVALAGLARPGEHRRFGGEDALSIGRPCSVLRWQVVAASESRSPGPERLVFAPSGCRTYPFICVWMGLSSVFF